MHNEDGGSLRVIRPAQNRLLTSVPPMLVLQRYDCSEALRFLWALKSFNAWEYREFYLMAFFLPLCKINARNVTSQWPQSSLNRDAFVRGSRFSGFAKIQLPTNVLSSLKKLKLSKKCDFEELQLSGHIYARGCCLRHSERWLKSAPTLGS